MASDSSDVEFELDLSPDEWEQETYEYLDSGKDSLNILTVGKLGVGKSSLVNSVLGTHLAKEATSAESITPHITPYTTRIPVPLETTSKFVDVTVWDTPGLGDAFSENYQDAVLEKCKDADVILYCMDMRQRLSRDDSTGITKLISLCGPEIVKNMVFALTFGNDLKPPPNSKEEPCAFFSNTLESWQNAIVKLLKKRHVLEDIITGIPIVPTGYKCHNPPDRTNWLDTFNSHVFNRMKDNAKPALVGISLNRLVWREDTSRIELIVPEELEPPLPRSAEPGPPLPRSAEPGPPLPRSAEPGPPLPTSAEPGPPLPTSAEPGPPLPTSAEPGRALPRSAEPGPPLPRAAEPGRALPRSAEPGPPLPRSAEPGPPLPRATEPGPPLPRAAEPGQPLPRSAHHNNGQHSRGQDQHSRGQPLPLWGVKAIVSSLVGGPLGGGVIGGIVGGVVASATAGSTAAAGTAVGTAAVGTATAGTVAVSTGIVIGAATGAIVGLGVGALIAYAIYRYVKSKRKKIE